MSVSRFLSPHYIIGAFAALGLFIIFNATRPALETETQARFTQWYEDAASYLATLEGTPTNVRKIQAAVVVSSASLPSGRSSEWIIPSAGLEEGEQRTRLARVLELIKESQIYGNSSYLGVPDPSIPHLSVTVTEGENVFSAAIPLAALENSIQMKNLLKLLEIFSATPVQPTPQINPNQL
jgi:hypothetical protein